MSGTIRAATAARPPRPGDDGPIDDAHRRGSRDPFVTFEGDPKLEPPPVRRHSVTRERLLERLLAHRDERIVAIFAPPGYGKTTLLAQWRQHERRPVAWLTLDRRDADPQAMIAGLGATIDRAIGLPADVRRTIVGASGPALATVVPRLASALHRRREPLVIMIDDVHAIARTPALDVLATLIGYLPEHVDVGIAGRLEPGLPLARWRAAGRLLELGVSDLALDEAESIRAAGLVDRELGHDAALAMHAATEGWPAALYLAARAGSEPSRRDIGDFIEAELLAGKDRRTRDFLLQTAILDQMTADLCDAVVGRPGSARILERLAATDHLVTSVGETGRWYRYHVLLREHLLDLLPGATIDSTVLHRRAAEWLASHDMTASAIDHLFEAGDVEAASTLFSDVALGIYRQNRTTTVARWVARLDEDALGRHPYLAVTAAIMSLVAGQARAAIRMAEIADASEYGSERPASAGDFEGARAMLRALLAREGLLAAVADAAEGVERLPEASPWGSVARAVHGSILLAAGETDAADDVLARVEPILASQAAGRAHILARAARAIVAARRDAWGDAARLSADAVDLVETYGHRGEATVALAHGVAARMAARRGDIAGARRSLSGFQSASTALSVATPWVSLITLIEASRAYLAISDPAGARNLLRLGDDILRRCPGMGPLEAEFDGLRERVRGLPAGLAGASTLTPAEIRVLLLLPTYLSVLEIADRLVVSSNTVRTQVQSIYGKLGASSRSEAVELAIEAGLLEPLPILAGR